MEGIGDQQTGAGLPGDESDTRVSRRHKTASSKGGDGGNQLVLVVDDHGARLLQDGPRGAPGRCQCPGVGLGELGNIVTADNKRNHRFDGAEARYGVDEGRPVGDGLQMEGNRLGLLIGD